MSDVPGNTALLWVCQDCYFAHHGILEEEPSEDREPLSKIPDHVEVTAGMFYEQHSDDCDYGLHGSDTDAGYECECEQISFSWSSCGGCGSSLGGDRHALTLWYPCHACPETINLTYLGDDKFACPAHL